MISDPGPRFVAVRDGAQQALEIDTSCGNCQRDNSQHGSPQQQSTMEAGVC
jgi:hypothetical protein